MESIKEKTKEYNAEYSLVIIKNKKALLLKTKSIDGDNAHMYIFYDKNRILIFSNTHPVGEEENFEKAFQETIESLIF